MNCSIFNNNKFTKKYTKLLNLIVFDKSYCRQFILICAYLLKKICMYEIPQE